MYIMISSVEITEIQRFYIMQALHVKKRAQQCLPRFLWRGRHFGTCESLGSSYTKTPRAFHDPSIQFDFHRAWERKRSLKFLKCAFTSTQTFEADALQLFLQSLFIILSFFAGIQFSVNVPGVPPPMMYFKLLQSPLHVGKVNKLKTPEMGLYFDSVV